MAVFGHSGSHAPQLMHSLVMTVAMAARIPSARREVQISSEHAGGRLARLLGEARGGDLMRRTMLVLGILAFAVAVRAQDNPEMRAAESDLKSAKSHLQAAPHDYGGHRKQALDHIDHALGQVHQGLAAVESKEKKVEHKEQKVEKKQQRLENRDQKL